MHYIKPYNDEKLAFIDDKYVITLQEFKRNFDSPYTDDGKLERRLKKNSRKIYNYLLYAGYSGNQKLILRLLNETHEGRMFVYDILMEEMEADVDSGFNDVSSQQPINMSSGQILPREELQRNQISVDAEQIIERNSLYFGFNILMPHAYTPSIYLRLLEE